MEKKDLKVFAEFLNFQTLPTANQIQKAFEEPEDNLIGLFEKLLFEAKEVVELVKLNGNKLPAGFKSENLLYLTPVIGGPLLMKSSYKGLHIRSKIEMTTNEKYMTGITGGLSTFMYITLLYFLFNDESVESLSSYHPVDMFNYFSAILGKYYPVVMIKTVVALIYNTYLITILRPKVITLLKEAE